MVTTAHTLVQAPATSAGFPSAPSWGRVGQLPPGPNGRQHPARLFSGSSRGTSRNHTGIGAELFSRAGGCGLGALEEGRAAGGGAEAELLSAALVAGDAAVAACAALLAARPASTSASSSCRLDPGSAWKLVEVKEHLVGSGRRWADKPHFIDPGHAVNCASRESAQFFGGATFRGEAARLIWRAQQSSGGELGEVAQAGICACFRSPAALCGWNTRAALAQAVPLAGAFCLTRPRCSSRGRRGAQQKNCGHKRQMHVNLHAGLFAGRSMRLRHGRHCTATLNIGGAR